MASIIFIPLFAFIICCYMYFADKYNTKYFNLFVFMALVIFSFLIGVRTNFGNDQITYMHSYVNQKLEYFEPIYSWLNILLFKYKQPFQVLFITVAFIEFYFLEKTAKVLNINYLFVVFFFFIFKYFAFFVNGLRQSIAISISMCAIVYFFYKRYLLFIFLLLIATGFHKSSLLFFILCPFVKLIKFSKKSWIDILFYIPLFFVFVFYNHIWDIILNLLQMFSRYLPNQFQVIIAAFSVWKIELGTGLGVKLQILGYIMILPNLLFYSKKDALSQYLFFIFYLGILGKYFSGQNMNLSRLFLGMEYCGIFLSAKIMPYFLKDNILKIRNNLFMLGIFIYIFLFLYDSVKGVNTVGPTPYIWDLDFSLKKYFGKGF